jgi:hypothetical protein
MSAHLLNVSIDSPDYVIYGNNEDTCFNEMESIVEVVLEQVLDFENIFMEQEESDTEKQGISFLKIQLHTWHHIILKMPFCSLVLKTKVVKSLSQIVINSSFYPEVVSPPPNC